MGLQTPKVRILRNCDVRGILVQRIILPHNEQWLLGWLSDDLLCNYCISRWTPAPTESWLFVRAAGASRILSGRWFLDDEINPWRVSYEAAIETF